MSDSGNASVIRPKPVASSLDVDRRFSPRMQSRCAPPPLPARLLSATRRTGRWSARQRLHAGVPVLLRERLVKRPRRAVPGSAERSDPPRRLRADMSMPSAPGLAGRRDKAQWARAGRRVRPARTIASGGACRGRRSEKRERKSAEQEGSRDARGRKVKHAVQRPRILPARAESRYVKRIFGCTSALIRSAVHSSAARAVP
jgi:hypothetical protein